MRQINLPKIVRAATIFIVLYLLCFGFAMAFFPIRPFWNDEWRLLYSLKFKSESELWGNLDLLQQFPRVFLILLKKITSAFDYSYTSLRLPALVISIASLFLCFGLKKKLYPQSHVNSFLFVLILVSSQTFTDYLVQVKQYEMEIFLSLLSLFQLYLLLKVLDKGIEHTGIYVLLCLSFLIAPFFSYTYTMAFMPIVPVLALKWLLADDSNSNKTTKFQRLASACLPIILCFISILVFYLVDVRHVMADKSMHNYWAFHMMGEGAGILQFVQHFWLLFSVVGSGLLFEIIFGALGLLAFANGVVNVIRIRRNDLSQANLFNLYAVLVLVLTLLLFLFNKLPLGVPRLSVFTVPAICILIVSVLDKLAGNKKIAKVSYGLSTLLFLGLFGNILSTCINTFTYVEYRQKIAIYKATSAAIAQARTLKVPIVITDGEYGELYDIPSGYPDQLNAGGIYKQHTAPIELMTPEIVLKTLPEYKLRDSIPVYFVKDMHKIGEYMLQLPPTVHSVIAGDGVIFKRIDKTAPHF